MKSILNIPINCHQLPSTLTIKYDWSEKRVLHSEGIDIVFQLIVHTFDITAKIGDTFVVSEEIQFSSFYCLLGKCEI